MDNVEGAGENSFFNIILILQVGAHITLVKIKIKINLQTGLFLSDLHTSQQNLIVIRSV